MITGYIPSLDHVLEYMFNICSHNVVNDSTPPFCDKCNSFVSDNEISRSEELEKGLSGRGEGIQGGYYISKLVRFLMQYGSLYFKGSKSKSWYTLCYEIDNSTFGQHKITYTCKSTQTFAFSVCWLSEILFRLLEEKGTSDEAIRRIINGD